MFFAGDDEIAYEVSKLLYGNSATCSSPVASEVPAQIHILHRLRPAAPFTQIVERRADDHAAGNSICRKPDNVMLEPRMWPVCGNSPNGSTCTTAALLHVVSARITCNSSAVRLRPRT